MTATSRIIGTNRNAARLTRRQALWSLGQAAAAFACRGSYAACAAATADGGKAIRGQLADEIERVMWDKVLDAWYPRCLDTQRGGFHENFSRDWTRGATDSKFLVYQARQTWTAAAVALAYPQRKDKFLQYARHGLRFLADKMWDAQRGGFFDRTDAAGQPMPDKMPWKQLYSYAFGIYAAAAVSEATGDCDAVELGKSAFNWLDNHAHDAECGGYFEHVTADGQSVAVDVPAEPLGRGLPVIGQVGFKSMNAHIHLLEALTALRRVWNDARLTARLQEVFEIVRDKIVLPGGHLNMFAARDFKPHDERGSFGHQLEIAYLLEEAADVLRRQDAEVTARTALHTVDHALRWGWDQDHGGFADEGPPTGPPTKTDKVWWVQVEGLNGLLTAARLAPQKDEYFRRFAETWAFFRKHMIDDQYGGCYETVTPDGKPLRVNKATPWKAAYHVTRALLFSTHELRRA
ncbi:MAG TPA: AGE family epimerase/isomerase [Candidatus Anammoximicrobium sp.]|nr:AGE family epimerase/isomerase [Candidatus Anammoximicrobium sp.]